MIYQICKQMIQKGQLEGIQDKLDVFWAKDRLTEAEYQELTELLNAAQGGK